MLTLAPMILYFCPGHIDATVMPPKSFPHCRKNSRKDFCFVDFSAIGASIRMGNSVENEIEVRHILAYAKPSIRTGAKAKRSSSHFCVDNWRTMYGSACGF